MVDYMDVGMEDEEIEDFSIDQIAELEELERNESERRSRVSQFINDMERPERVLAMSDDDKDETTNNTETNKEDAATKEFVDGNGTFTQEPTETIDPTATTDNNTEGGGGGSSKIKFDIFSFLELSKVPEWYNLILIHGSEVGHDRFSKIEELIEERKQIFAVTSTDKNLTDDQRTYYKNRYDIVDAAINERVEGRKSIAQRMDFPQPMKQKFGEAFKGWIESLNIQYELSPGLLLLIMFVASLLYAFGVVYMTQKSYQKP